jgi:uncharacterized protein (UPF0332 family)/predicted nucleotidyltransferase
VATLADASLTSEERRVLRRFVALLEDELGERLRGVWLYGSRARGEHSDGGSDIDLLVVMDRPDDDLVRTLIQQAGEEEGANPYVISAFAVDESWLADRRDARAFFVLEVERDKIVLAGSDLPGTLGPREPAVTRRTAEYLDNARYWLGLASDADAGGLAGVVPHAAYYAILNATRAGFSERDRFVRGHRETWELFKELFVDSGELPAELHLIATSARVLRESTDYAGKRITPEAATAAVRDAQRFVAAMEELIAPEC